MDQEIRQAERDNDQKRLGLLNCRRGEHWWSGWDDTPRIRWNENAIHRILGVPHNNQGLLRGQTSAITKRRQCFWCGRNQWHLKIYRWGGDPGATKTVAELYHEVD